MKYSEVYPLNRIDWGSSYIFSSGKSDGNGWGVSGWGISEGAGFGDGRGDSSWILFNIIP